MAKVLLQEIKDALAVPPDPQVTWNSEWLEPRLKALVEYVEARENQLKIIESDGADPDCVQAAIDRFQAARAALGLVSATGGGG